MRRNWRDDARKAISELSGVSHGAREAEMRTIARHLSGHTDTSSLRRAIAAHEFLEHLRTAMPVSYEHLENASLSIVEIISRWFSFDQLAALAAAKDWANGIGNVRSIGKAMQESRSPGYAGKSGAALGRAYVADAKSVVVAAVKALVQPEAKLSDVSVRNEATGQTLDFVFDVSKDHPRGRIAVIVVGPYSNKKLYGSRSGDWVTRAFGLAWIFEKVVLALPDVEALPEYKKRIDAVRAEFVHPKRPGGGLPSVEVIHTDVPKTTPEEDDAIAQFGPFG